MARKTYKLKLTTLGPVHIGNGNQYGKKDYFVCGDKIAILQASRFVEKLSSENLEKYCEFLQENSRVGLRKFLEENRLTEEAKQAKAYQIDFKLSRNRSGEYQYFDVFEFIKDAHGLPYVPGSSVKGMLRTGLMIGLIAASRDEFRTIFARGSDARAFERKAFFAEQPDVSHPEIINDCMRYISVSDSRPLSCADLVFTKKYDKFATSDDGSHKRQMGRLSDEKYYQGNELNIYRECLKPDTVIECDLSIDEAIDNYLPCAGLDAATLLELLSSSFELYSECFLKHFEFAGDESSGSTGIKQDGKCRYILEEGPFAGKCCRNAAVGDTGYCTTHKDKAGQSAKSGTATNKNVVYCYLGGGVGYGSKTVVNALFEQSAHRLDATAKILYDQFPSKVDKSIFPGLWDSIVRAGFQPKAFCAVRDNSGRLKKGKEDHRHWRDPELGVSPHTLKLGKIGSELYEMGKCSVAIEEA